MKRVALLAAVATLGLSACGSGREEDSVPADRGVAAKGLPDVARVACKENGTRVRPTTVKPQPDGVHLEVVNRVDDRMRVNVGDKTDGALYQGLDAPLGTSEEVLDVRPGSIWLACRGSLADPLAQPAVLEVVDEDNVGSRAPAPRGTARPASLGFPTTCVMRPAIRRRPKRSGDSSPMPSSPATCSSSSAIRRQARRLSRSSGTASASGVSQ
jgi:hypothetical protein